MVFFGIFSICNTLPNFLELSKYVFGFFVAQLGKKLAGGRCTPPPRQKVVKNFRVKNRVNQITVILEKGEF